MVLVLSRVTGPVDPGPIDDLVRLGGGGRDTSAVDLLFRLAPRDPNSSSSKAH